MHGKRSMDYSSDSMISEIDLFHFKKEFLLRYQPVLSLDNQSLYALEGLTYWQSNKARVYGTEPLTLSEKSQLNAPFHQWVINEVCRQLQSWKMQNIGDVLSFISINLSAKPAFYSYLAEYIAQALQKIGVDPSCLELEISAQWIMQNKAAVRSTIDRFRKAGILIGIDDLNFSDLSSQDWFDLPIRTIKITKIDSLEILRNDKARKLLEATLSRANKADIHVIAKNIETTDQLLAMQLLGFTYGQGFLLSEPLLSRQATALISSRVGSLSTDLLSYLRVMGILDRTAQKFLGKTVVARYWSKSKPVSSWLAQVEPSKNLDSLLHLVPSKKLNIDQQNDLQNWSKSFIQLCSTIIRDFPQRLAQDVNTPSEERILVQLQA